jgi:hypothetical protein
MWAFLLKKRDYMEKLPLFPMPSRQSGRIPLKYRDIFPLDVGSELFKTNLAGGIPVRLRPCYDKEEAVL